MSEWQDIETAPKDGTDVLLAIPTGIDIGNWQDEKPDGTECGVVVDPGLPAGWYGYLGLCPWDEEQPTHWMPLPALPSRRGDGDDKPPRPGQPGDTSKSASRISDEGPSRTDTP